MNVKSTKGCDDLEIKKFILMRGEDAFSHQCPVELDKLWMRKGPHANLTS